MNLKKENRRTQEQRKRIKIMDSRKEEIKKVSIVYLPQFCVR